MTFVPVEGIWSTNMFKRIRNEEFSKNIYVL